MTRIYISYDSFGLQNLECETCGVVFQLTWNRDGVTDAIEFCPFCGSEVDELVQEEEPNE